MASKKRRKNSPGFGSEEHYSELLGHEGPDLKMPTEMKAFFSFLGFVILWVSASCFFGFSGPLETVKAISCWPIKKVYECCIGPSETFSGKVVEVDTSRDWMTEKEAKALDASFVVADKRVIEERRVVSPSFNFWSEEACGSRYDYNPTAWSRDEAFVITTYPAEYLLLSLHQNELRVTVETYHKVSVGDLVKFTKISRVERGVPEGVVFTEAGFALKNHEGFTEVNEKVWTAMTKEVVRYLNKEDLEPCKQYGRNDL